MPMELNRRELKAQARERMRETRPPFWLVTLVYLLLTTGVSTLADLTGAAQLTFPPSSGDTLPLFLYLLILLYTTVMNFGYQIWALRVYRRQQAGYGTLIDGFSMAGRVLLMELYIFGCTLCWALAFGTAGGLALFLMDGSRRFCWCCCSMGRCSASLCGSPTAMPWPPSCSWTGRRRGPSPRCGRAWP